MKSKEEKEDDPIDEYNHGRMLEAIKSIASENKRWTASQRTETVPVSEFTQKFKDEVDITSLMKSLNKSAKLIEVGKKIKKSLAQKLEALPIPLEKPAAMKINRVVSYDKFYNEVAKWDKVVLQNRAADQLVFPLDQPDMKMQMNDEVVNRFKLCTPLELEVQALLKLERPIVKESVKDQEIASNRQTLEELAEMRNEMRKIRARMSYEEAKAKYRKKIKSKRYHRILKKERMKKQEKEFEVLQKTNPELAQAKLESLDRARALERMTLRHRNTGKWAREQIQKFRNDKESGRAIMEQIQLSRQLTEKAFIPSDSEEEEDDKGKVEAKASSDSKEVKLSTSDASNPWMNGFTRFTLGNARKSVKDDVESKLLVGYRKYWEEENRGRQSKTNEGSKVTESDSDEVESNVDVPKKKPIKMQSEKIMKCHLNGKGKAADTVKPNKDVSRKKALTKYCSSNRVEGAAKVKSDDVVSNKKPKTKRPKKKGKTKNNNTQEQNVFVKKLEKSDDNVSKKKRPKEKVKTVTINNETREDDGSVQKPETSTIKKAGTKRKDKSQKPNKESKEKMTPTEKLHQLFKTAENQKASLKNNKVAKKSNSKPIIDVVDDIKNGKETEKQTEEVDEDDNIDETLIRKRHWEDFDHFEPERNKRPRKKLTSEKPLEENEKSAAVPKETEEDVVVNPHDFITVKGKVIKCHISDEAYNDDEALDDVDDDEQTVDNRMTIAEAFADDDVIDEFVAEKECIIDNDKPKDIDLALPGWGEWGGIGAKISDWKKKKYTFKPPPGPPRKDKGLSNVIINEQADEIVKKFQVVDIPKGFDDNKSFERSIAAPIGKQWNPETAFTRLIAPRVVTKMGAIIEPIDDSFLEKMEKREVVSVRNKKTGGRK